MSDDAKRTGSPDSKRIDLDQPHEVRFWSAALEVSPERLREAVHAVGTSAAAVRKYLQEHKPTNSSP